LNFNVLNLSTFKDQGEPWYNLHYTNFFRPAFFGLNGVCCIQNFRVLYCD